MLVFRLCVDGLSRAVFRSIRLIAHRWHDPPGSRSKGINLHAPIYWKSGFTIVEIVAALTLFSILAAMSIGSLSYYLAGRSLDTGAAELVSQIHEAQSLAVATGNTYRIDFSDSSHTVYTLQRRQGSQWVNVRGPMSLPGVQFSSTPSFGNDGYLEFYARGTSESGQLFLISRYGRSKSLQVNGETVNVTVS